MWRISRQFQGFQGGTSASAQVSIQRSFKIKSKKTFQWWKYVKNIPVIVDIHKNILKKCPLNFHIRQLHLLISTIRAFLSMRTARSWHRPRMAWTTSVAVPKFPEKSVRSKRAYLEWNELPISHQYSKHMLQSTLPIWFKTKLMFHEHHFWDFWQNQGMPHSMDWFKGTFTGKPHDLNGKIDGFRLRFSPTNQSIEVFFVYFAHLHSPGSSMSLYSRCMASSCGKKKRWNPADLWKSWAALQWGVFNVKYWHILAYIYIYTTCVYIYIHIHT